MGSTRLHTPNGYQEIFTCISRSLQQAPTEQKARALQLWKNLDGFADNVRMVLANDSYRNEYSPDAIYSAVQVARTATEHLTENNERVQWIRESCRMKITEICNLVDVLPAPTSEPRHHSTQPRPHSSQPWETA